MSHQFQTTLNFISDPGHGWLVVPLADIAALNVQDKITHFSFISLEQKVAWLEEDMDATTYIEAARAAGVELRYESLSIHHFHRSFPRFGDDRFNPAFWSQFAAQATAA